MLKKFIIKACALAVSIMLLCSVIFYAVAETTVDIASDIGISLWNATGNANELTYACLQFPSGSMPNTIQYGILDNNSYKYIGDYIYFCGKSVNTINSTTDTSSYTFSTFPSSAAPQYRLPIILFQNGNNIEIKVHNKYLQSLSANPIDITVKSGLSLINGGKTYSVNSDVSFKYNNGSWESNIKPQENDITDDISLNGWFTTGGASELKYTSLVFPIGVLPSGIDYGIIDREQYKYIGDYITLNGITVNDINSSTDTSSYTFSTFPSSAAPQYRLPIILFQNGNSIEIKIHSKYLMAIGTKLNISVLKGLSIKNGNKSNTVSETVSFELKDSAWERPAEIVDLKEKVSIDGFNVTGSASELKYTIISFESGILPQSIGYGIIDNDIYKYMGDYIAVNGKTVNEINSNTSVSGYNFATFPSNADDKYKLPVIIYQNGNSLEVKIHKKYIDSLIDPVKDTNDAHIEISLLKDFSILSGKKNYLLQEDMEYEAYRYEEPTDIYSGTSINGFYKTGDKGELNYTVISFEKDVLPQDIGYGVIDNDRYKYIGDYITVNGKTVNSINAETDITGYTFSTFPSSADDKYKLPVIVFQNNDALEVKIHENYVNSIKEKDKKVIIGLQKGLSFTSKGKTLLLKKSIEYTAYKYYAPTDMSSDIKIDGYNITGDKNELCYTVISFKKGELPNDIGYGIIDNVNYQYIGDYITVNGKTINKINSETNVKGYDFATFPSNADDKYKLPVIVLQNGDTLEVKIHKTYSDSLAKKDKKITIGLKSGLSLTTDGKTYLLNKNLSYVAYKYIKPSDISSHIKIDGYNVTGDKNELFYTVISFKKGELPNDIGYGVIDNANYKYIGDYITVNGKTVNKINAETNVKGYDFATFPSNADKRYRLPIIVFQNGDTLELKIHKTYSDSLAKKDKKITIGLKSGLSLTTDGKSYLLNKNLSYVAYKYIKPYDISSHIKIDGFMKTGDKNELRYTVISFKKGELPNDIGYGVIDNANYKYIGDYITVNGKTVNKINAYTNVKGYDFATFPSNADKKYRLPIVVFQNGNTLEIKIHSKYIENELDGKNITVGVKKGLGFSYSSKAFEIKKDISKTVYKYIKMTEKTIENISVNGFNTTGDKAELKSTFLKFENVVFPDSLYYGIIDNPEYKYIGDYIEINGKTVNEINKTTSVKGYDFASFPSNEMDYFRLPVIMYVEGNTIEVRIHSKYLSTLGDKVKITVKKGLKIERNSTRYVLKKNYSFVNKKGIWGGQGTITDIHDGVNAFGWTAEGKTTHSVYFEFGDYPVLKGISDDPYSYGKSLLEFVTVNGKTAKEINDTVSVKDYKWDTFPSNTIDSYKCPVILYANPDSNTLQVRIHNNYIGKSEEIKVGLNEDFKVERLTDGKTVYYCLSKPVEYIRVNDKWVDLNKKYSVTYYLNGREYGQPQSCSFMEKISLADNPAVKKGYKFSGWKTENDFKDGVLENIEVYGYITPIRYKIKYVLNGGENSIENPIFYTAQSGEIVLKDAKCKGMKFEGWYFDKNFKNKVTTLSAVNNGDITLYAEFSGKKQNNFDFSEFLDGRVSTVILAVMTAVAVLLGFILIKDKKEYSKQR